MTTETDASLTILLVEDNRGDARYIEEMLEGATELAERTVTRRESGQLEDAAGGDQVIPTVTRLEDGLERIDEGGIDIVLLDLNLPDSKGVDTVKRLRERTESVPVVVLTGLRGREIGMEALGHGAEEYLVKDEINPDLLVRSVYHALERKEQERELKRQRNRLATRNSLNDLVDEISHLAIESSTREELEAQVCERLADSEWYLFAWIGEVDRNNERITLRTEAGVEGYLDDITIRVDDSDLARGPTGQAVRTGETRTARNIPENPDYEPWRGHDERYGFRSSAAIPIAHEETLYGILNIYSQREDAFGTDEREVISRLSEVIGHAINAIERKQALMSEEVVELRFHIENVADSVDIDASVSGRIDFERAVPVSDDVFLEYGTVTEDGVETLRSLVEGLPHFDSVTLLDEEGETRRFELRLTEPPAISAVASYGGRVESATIEDGDYTMVVHVPPSADISRVVETVKEEYPAAVVTAHRHTTRSKQPATRLESTLTEALTEKQRGTLESAYFAGFFEWPRDSSGEDVAESMGVSPSTFHQHLRTAERKLCRVLFETDLEA